MRMRRLELLLLSEPDPKSGAATNYATPARKLRGKNTTFFANGTPIGDEKFQRHIMRCIYLGIATFYLINFINFMNFFVPLRPQIVNANPHDNNIIKIS